MRDENIRIRVAAPEDAAQLLAIYTPYVERTAITFEYDVPTLEEFRGRIARTLQKYPYLTAERGGELLGYAYLSPFVGRAAYQWAAETSIYLRMDSRGLGLGRALYEAMERVALAQNLTNLEACIGRPAGEGDEYLTDHSVAFHTHMGYRMVGQFDRCGCKFGRWYHMAWMEKVIAPHVPDPAPFRPFPALAGAELAALLRP